MADLLNQFFWLWLPFTLIPEGFRIALAVFLVIIFARPILFRAIPRMVYWISKGLAGLLWLIAYPFQLLIHLVQQRRRAKGKGNVPILITAIEGLFEFLERLLNGLTKVSQKRIQNIRKIRAAFRSFAVILAFILPLAIINNPEQPYASAWHTFDQWITEDKLMTDLGYQPASLLAKTENVLTDQLVLTEEYQDGGNIRQEPSLEADSVAEIAADDVIDYLDETSEDSDGRVWLKVRTADGTEGWISDKIVEAYEG